MGLVSCQSLKDFSNYVSLDLTYQHRITLKKILIEGNVAL